MSVASNRPFYSDIIAETEHGDRAVFSEEMNKFLDALVDKVSRKQRQIDSSDGDPYGQLSGTIDGANDTFTLTQGNVHAGSIAAYINGTLTDAFAETDLEGGVITMDTAPTGGQKLIFIYEYE